ncbi:hypothetical protein GGI43DRAFT_386590 [Trichoderma evansii]
MRASSVAVVLAACVFAGIAAVDEAPQCAVDCASGIRNANGSLDLKAICADKLMTNSLFQCLIGSCPQETYGPAVAHVVLACSDLGLSIGPLHPVEVQHVDLKKPPYLPTPSLPDAYAMPSLPSQQNTEHLTLSFDISLDLKCNSGPDGLVTVSLPPPAPSPPAPSPPAPSPPAPSPPTLPPSSPTTDPENGEDEGENGDGDGGDNNNSGDNDNENPTVSSSPAGQTTTMPDPADPSATSSCPPDSAPSSVQDPSNGHAPPQPTELGEHGNPAVTSAPSPTPPNGEDDPESLSSKSPCSTASDAAGGSDPEDPEDPNQSDPSPSPTQEASNLPNDGDKPEVSATSDVEGMPASSPAPPTPAPASNPCSTTNGADMSADPIPGPQVPQTAEPTPVAQTSSLPCSSSSPAPTSLTESGPLSTIHPTPLPLPLPSPPSYQTIDDSGNIPPEYAPSRLSGQSPGGENSDSETGLPESNTEPLPQENHDTEVDEPSSYEKHSQVPPAPVSASASQTDALAVQDADGKPTDKTTEPSEVTLWPTATSNRTLCTTGSPRGGGPPTTSCKSHGKQTTAHPPRSNPPVPSGVAKDALSIDDNQQNESPGSVMIKIIRLGDHNAEMMLTDVWGNSPPATTLSREIIQGMERNANGHDSATPLGIGSSPTAQSTANTARILFYTTQ